MKPWLLLDTVEVSESGDVFRLFQHDNHFSIKLNNVELMNSRMHGSEEELGRLACKKIEALAKPRILVGGLGMGFTLRAALDVLPAEASVVVSELVPAVVKWNRETLAPLAKNPLRDRRVSVHEEDVREMIRAGSGSYSAILLDVDNGPQGLFRKSNERLYTMKGLYAAFAALRRQGVLAVWSSAPDLDFTRRLRAVGFQVEEVRVNARSGPKAGGYHRIWLAVKPLPVVVDNSPKPAYPGGRTRPHRSSRSRFGGREQEEQGTFREAPSRPRRTKHKKKARKR